MAIQWDHANESALEPTKDFIKSEVFLGRYMNSHIFKNFPITFYTLYLLKSSCQPIKLALSRNDLCSQKNLFGLLDTRKISLASQYFLQVSGDLKP